MPYKVEIKTAPAQTIAVVRRKATLAELTRVVPEGCGQAWNFFRAAGVSGGRNIALYLDDEINLEVGAEVNAPFAGDGNVYCSATPAGVVATTIHIGPYHQLPCAHRAVRDWCAANGRAMAGPNWEVYGHWTDDPSQLRTDIFYLLAD